MNISTSSSMGGIKAPHFDTINKTYTTSTNDNDYYGVIFTDNTNISSPAPTESQNRNNQNYREIGVGVYLTPEFITKTDSQMNNLDSEFRSIFTVPITVSISRTTLSNTYHPPSETITLVVDPDKNILPTTYYFQNNTSYTSSSGYTLNMPQTDKGGSNL